MTANDASASAAVGSLVSSLMDGDLEPDAATGTLARWHHDADMRATWHAYQLIGDVLRSDDLATPPAQDEAFLRALRGRLSQEPVPLSPGQAVSAVAAAAAAARRWPAWLVAPAAVAAGFVAVAGLLVVTRVVSINPADSGQLALAAPGATANANANATDLVRNAGLDRYLEAHRTLANGVVAGGAAEHRVQIVFEAK